MKPSRLTRVLQDAATPLHQRSAEADAVLVKANQELSVEIAQLRLRILELEHAADTDPLVPVYNRRAFLREIARAQNVMDRYDMLSTIIFFDLNEFKSVNDRFGHGVGDQLLKMIGNVLQDGVRDCDMVARLGGDEFGILLFKSDLDVARAKAQALCCRIADQTVDMPTGSISISAAWGVAPCEPGDSVEQVLARADRAMYMSKRSRA
ncbi:MAG: GGDEF domain-containing protein [Litorimonas sp.]